LLGNHWKWAGIEGGYFAIKIKFPLWVGGGVSFIAVPTPLAMVAIKLFSLLGNLYCDD
jgi:hypothetical protein